jgi:hypothetical protein
VNPAPRWRLAFRAGVAGGAAVLVAVLAQAPAAGSFTALTGSSGNGVATATSFCVSPGAQDVLVANDAWTDESAAATGHGTTAALEVRSGAGSNHRTYLRFTLPGAPKHCDLVGAQLRMRVSSPTSGRTIDVHRADPAQNPQWTAAALTWSNQPGFVGTRVGSASLSAAGMQTWDVTAHTLLLYSGPNNGFVLKDRTEGQTGPYTQLYDEQSTAGGTPPVLRLTWG